MSNIELDRREVLMHLHEMGYYNITPQQLDEFITDLKKLIKFDIAKKKIISKPSTKMQYTEESTSSTIPNTTEESVSPSPPPPPDHHKHWAHRRSGRSQSKHMDEASCSSSDSLIAPSKMVLRECSKIAAQRAQEKDNIITKHTEASRVPAKPSKSCDCLWRRIGCKCCDEKWNRDQNSIKTAKSKENLAPPRPKSSFIRTWQLTGEARPGSAPQRCDPVTLYHQYQRLWKQQKLPGEDNHNALRWSVRERMLGQEPHPRPLSQASSVRSISQRSKRL